MEEKDYEKIEKEEEVNPSVETKENIAVNYSENHAEVSNVKETASDSKKVSKTAQIIGTVIFLAITLFIVFWIVKRYFVIQ